MSLSSYKPSTCNVVKHIIDTGNHAPVTCSPEFTERTNLKCIEIAIQKMMKMDIIESSQSVRSNPLIIVPREKSSHYVFEADFGQLNQITKSYCYSLSSVEFITEIIAKAEFVTVLKVQAGLFHIMIDEDSRDKTTFVSHVGTYRFKKNST